MSGPEPAREGSNVRAEARIRIQIQNVFFSSGEQLRKRCDSARRGARAVPEEGLHDGAGPAEEVHPQTRPAPIAQTLADELAAALPFTARSRNERQLAARAERMHDAEVRDPVQMIDPGVHRLYAVAIHVREVERRESREPACQLRERAALQPRERIGLEQRVRKQQRGDVLDALDTPDSLLGGELAQCGHARRK
jgi:hypothetical protein